MFPRDRFLPIRTTRPPLPLDRSPVELPDDRLEVDDHGHVVGRAIRQCKNHVHVFADCGYCQCGSEFWESPAPDALPEETAG